MQNKYKVLLDPDAPSTDGGGGVAIDNPSGGASHVAVPGLNQDAGVSQRWGKNFTIDAPLPDTSGLKGKEIDFGSDDNDNVGIKDVDPAEKETTVEDKVVVDAPAKGTEKEVVKEEKKLTIPQQEVKKEEVKEVKPAEVKPVADKTQQTTKLPKDRDLSSYPVEIQDSLRKMSNDAFTLFDKTFVERNELKTKKEEYEAQIKQIEEQGLPLSYFSHPQAVTLHPMYQQASSRLGMIRNEIGFWQDQLNRIEAGETWQSLEKYDAQTGKPIFSAEQQPNDEAKNYVRNIINRGTIQGTELETKIGQMIGGYQAHIGSVMGFIDKTIDQYWPWNKDPKNPAQKHVKEFESLIPIETRHEKSARVASLLYASLQQVSSENAELKKQLAAKGIIAKQEGKIEPSVASTTTPSADNPLSKLGVSQFGPNGKQNKFVPPAKINFEELD